MRLVSPLRFVSGTIGLWIAARIVMLMPDSLSGRAQADEPAGPIPSVHAADPRQAAARAPADGPFAAWPADSPAVPFTVTLAGRGGPAAAVPIARPAAPIGASPAATISPAGIVTPASPIEAGAFDRGPPDATPALAAGTPSSRWSGSLYLFRRGDGEAALATGGQLGGSQAGGRIAYRLHRDGPTRFAAAARISTPLDDPDGAEAAIGLDWHPLPARPLRLSVERRVDLGGSGRDAWSAYAAGGFYREGPGRLVLDGYAQVGIVGARRRDLFADGALRAGLRQPLGPGRALTIGAGAWGAAQPRVERLDIGPRAAIGLPLAGTAATLAAEWRIRVAGDARPGSSLAITLAADF